MCINLKDLRMKKGLTQQEVAEKTKISRSYYTIIENSTPTRVPTVTVIKKISQVLDFEWQRYYDD